MFNEIRGRIGGMKMKWIRKSVVLISILLLLSPSSSSIIPNPMESTTDVKSLSAETLDEVPYIWQEINGFCYSAAATMALQYAGIDISLHEFLAASGLGLSAFYVRSDRIMFFKPGPFYDQFLSASKVCELYGLSHRLYADGYHEIASTVAHQVYMSGQDFVHIESEIDAFNIMRSIIDAGYPLVVAVDPYYLPPEDYEFTRIYDIRSTNTGSAHMIVITGYDDLNHEVYVLDPGVGALGDNYGYPEDGRYEYTISYNRFSLAWAALGYWTESFIPNDTPTNNFDKELGSYLVDRLLGNRSSYFQGTDSFYYLSVGEKAFRGLSLDLTTIGIHAYIQEFDGKENQTIVLYSLAVGLESMITLQYLAYKVSIRALPNLLPNIDLSLFLSKCEEAIPHFESLSHNSSLIDVMNPLGHSSLLLDTFSAIAEDYQTSDDLSSILQDYTNDIEEISSHLMMIADSWYEAGAILNGEVSGPEDYGLSFVIIGIGICVIAIVIIVLLRRKQ